MSFYNRFNRQGIFCILLVSSVIWTKRQEFLLSEQKDARVTQGKYISMHITVKSFTENKYLGKRRWGWKIGDCMWFNSVDGHLLFIWLNCACYFKYWLVDNHFMLRFLSSNFLAPPNFISTIETLFFNKIHQCILTCGMQQQLLELFTSSPFKSFFTSASNLFDIFLIYSFQVFLISLVSLSFSVFILIPSNDIFLMLFIL